jgi:hypothetical protein
MDGDYDLLHSGVPISPRSPLARGSRVDCPPSCIMPERCSRCTRCFRSHRSAQVTVRSARSTTLQQYSESSAAKSDRRPMTRFRSIPPIYGSRDLVFWHLGFIRFVTFVDFCSSSGRASQDSLRRSINHHGLMCIRT